MQASGGNVRRRVAAPGQPALQLGIGRRSEEYGNGGRPALHDLQRALHVDNVGSALLFSTPTCPNCRLAVTMLDKQHFPYEKLNAEENAELAMKYGVKQAPTLVVTDGDHFEKYAGAGAIKQYASAHMAQ